MRLTAFLLLALATAWPGAGLRAQQPAPVPADTEAPAPVPAPVPAVLFGPGDGLDHSLVAGGEAALARYTAETGQQVRVVGETDPAQAEQALRRLAQEGHSPILAVGAAQAQALGKVAGEFPALSFGLVGAQAEGANLRSILFRDQEGAYLAGLLAGMAADGGKVGFVGGMDGPKTRQIACGFLQGARAARPDAVVFQNMAGDGARAWSDPQRGAVLARSQIDRGAEVIFQAAGETGIGVLRAAADAGRLGIGFGLNQNALQPGRVLTSVLRRGEVALRLSLEAAREGRFTPGTVSYGIKEGAIGWVFDEANKGVVTAPMREAADKAQAAIAAGALAVHDFTADSACAA
ncbi:BMP family ABC transporter substrate-binding protein [Bosea sp. TWI1241]|uniref:BMP family ABC transporter substrate-binding protein n=1 Tax=Bosea sp. TWI1241 TaxID=3148904 RepID=UPI0032079DBA